MIKGFVKWFIILLALGMEIILFHSCRSIIDTTEDYTLNYSRVTTETNRQSFSKNKTEVKGNQEQPSKKATVKSAKTVNKMEQPAEESLKNTQPDKRVEKRKHEVVRRKINKKSVRFRIVHYSKKFIGVKYKYGGRNPFGFDCSGFTYYVFKKYDILLPATAKDQSTFGAKIPIEAANIGDLLFFDMGEGVGHVALVISNDGDQLIMRHASSSLGVTDEDYFQSDYWKKRYLFTIDVLLDK